MTRVLIVGVVVLAGASGACRADQSRPTQDDRALVRPATNNARRVALVVGNDRYPRAALTNGVNDARAVTAALTDVGFATTQVLDATVDQFDRAIDTFVGGVRAGDVVLIYFSGHALELRGENFLLPIDFDADSEGQVKRRSVSANELLQRLEGKSPRVRIMVLDACRNNPFGGTRAFGTGLARLESTGTLIAFATAPGMTASDNRAGSNGLFTTHFLAALKQPGLGAVDLFRRVREQVYEGSSGKQTPFLSDGLIGDFVFRPAAAVVASSTPVPADDTLAQREELALWQGARDAGTAAALEDYLHQYPHGRYRVVAEETLGRLRAHATVPTPTIPTPPPPSNPIDASPDWVRVQPGDFQMGCSPGDTSCADYEKPHLVRLTRGFEMRRHEVTQAEWEAVMKTNPSRFKGTQLPVDSVSWDDAERFLNQLNSRRDGYRYRLPTEAEWEYAARSGTKTPYYGSLGDIAWYASNAAKTTHPVGQKRPNQWGLYDMLGNVPEWVADFDDHYPSGLAVDPTGPGDGQLRVLRGGSWNDTDKGVRATVRDAAIPSSPGDRRTGHSPVGIVDNLALFRSTGLVQIGFGFRYVRERAR